MTVSPEAQQIAEAFHATLAAFLMEVLGVTPENAVNDAVQEEALANAHLAWMFSAWSVGRQG